MGRHFISVSKLDMDVCVCVSALDVMGEIMWFPI